jgi:hypothetical protein
MSIYNNMQPTSLALVLGLFCGAANAQSPTSATLDHPEAFERSYGTSFYTFDACGDALGGRLFRQALVERFNQCPFTAPAKALFRNRILAQRVKSSKMIEHMIEITGGLPLRLEGMAMTCREQQSLPEYVTFRDRLYSFSHGQIAANEIIPAKCEADNVAPRIP